MNDYRFDNYRLVAAARELWQENTLVVLPRRVFDCLLYLIEQRDRAVGRDELAAAVWDRVDVSDGQIGQLVMRVRRALGDDGQSQALVRTIPGFGYRWIRAVDEVPADTSAPTDSRCDADDPDATESNDSPDRNPTVDMQPTPTRAAAPTRTRMARWLGLALAAVLTAALVLIAIAAIERPDGTPNMTPVDATALIVLPVRVDEDAVDAGWIRLGIMDLIADRLRMAGLPVPQSDHTLMMLARHPAAADADAATRLASLPGDAGVASIVSVKARRTDQHWELTLDAASNTGARYQQSAEHEDLLHAARLATDRLLAMLGRSPPPSPVDPAIDERLRRAQAALLSNELDTARAILTVDQDGAAPSPEIAFRLAQIDYRAGRLDEAGAAWDALLDDTVGTHDPLLRSRILRARGSLNIRRGDDIAAERDFDAAAALVGNRDAPSELGWALNGRGMARLILDRPDDAAADLGRARTLLEQAGDIHGVVSTDNNMGVVELIRLRPAQAVVHSGQAARRFEALGAINEALSAQAVVVEAHLLQLQWPDALAVSDRGWALRDRIEDPDVDLSLLLNRARILLGLGRLAEAAETLTDVEQRYASARPWNRAEMHAVLAEQAWAHGDPRAASVHASRALALQPGIDGGTRRELIALLAERAQRLTGGVPAIARRPSNLETLQRLVEAEEEAAGNPTGDAADAAFGDALLTASARGLPVEVATVAASYGRWLLDRDRLDDAAAVIGRIAPWAQHDFDCAVMQVALFHRRGETRAWTQALDQAKRLAGERPVPARLTTPPSSADGGAMP